MRFSNRWLQPVFILHDGTLHTASSAITAVFSHRHFLRFLMTLSLSWRSLAGFLAKVCSMTFPTAFSIVGTHTHVLHQCSFPYSSSCLAIRCPQTQSEGQRPRSPPDLRVPNLETLCKMFTNRLTCNASGHFHAQQRCSRCGIPPCRSRKPVIWTWKRLFASDWLIPAIPRLGKKNM